jgi:hypothetical protein
MKTRAKKILKTVAEETDCAIPVVPKVQLAPESTNPPHLFILPKDLCSEARIVSIENPRDGKEDRYLVCPESGFYEFTNVAVPKTAARSWLLNSIAHKGDGQNEDNPKGFVTKTANLFIATPIDPIFFVLPALAPEPRPNAPEHAKKLFLAGDEYIDKVATNCPNLSSLLRIESLRGRLKNRLISACDTVDAGGEVMYRLKEEKLLQELLMKARKMVENGLTPSMEGKFIRKGMESPMLSIKRDLSSLSEDLYEEDPRREDGATTPDTQKTSSTLFSEASTTATSFSGETAPPKTTPPVIAPEGVADLLRLRTAFFFICSAYLAPHLTQALKNLLSSPSSPVDFGPLEDHLAHLTKLRHDALAARSLGDYSRKRTMNGDDEGLESRAEKKRKKDEEEKKKKAGESRGVRDLKRVNVSGMKKMSDFFKKKS